MRKGATILVTFWLWLNLSGQAHVEVDPRPPKQDKDQLLEQLWTHLRAQAYPAAVEILEKWAAAEPSNYKVHNLLGTSKQRAGQPSAATTSYLRALELKPNSSVVRLNLALNYLHLGRYADAAKQFGILLREVRTPSPSRSLHHQAPIGPQLERFARFLNSNEVQYLSLGGILLAHNLPEAASVIFTVGCEALPESAHLQQALGRAYQKMKKFKPAAASFHKALELQPDFLESCLDLGYAYSSMAKLHRARATYLDCVRMDPAKYAGHYFLGSTLLREAPPRFDDAIVHLERALHLNPRSLNSRFQLGKAYAAKGLYSKALRAFRIVVGEDPENESALFHLGMLYQKLGHADEARKHIEVFERLKVEARQRSRKELLFGSTEPDQSKVSEVADLVFRFYARYKEALLKSRYEEIWNLLTESSKALYVHDLKRFRETASRVYSDPALRERIRRSSVTEGQVISGRIVCRFHPQVEIPLPPLVLARWGEELRIDYAFDLSLPGLISLGAQQD